MNRIFQVFRTGTHTDSAGVERTFSAEDLRAIADRFDPEVSAAPIVKGHPATDAPAFGWVDRFVFEENSGVLYAVPRDVDPGFKAEVNAKRYHRISLALYSPEASNNPVPGMYYPRHVGFLGAAAPAVKGLKAANFNDNDEGYLMFDLNNEADVSKFSEIFGKTLLKLGFKPAEEPGKPQPGTGVDIKTSPEYKELETERVALETKLNKAQEAADKLKAKGNRTECAAFTEKLVTEGRITPVEAGRLTEILFSMSALDGELEFTEGDDKATVKGTALGLLKGILEKLPERISYGEFSGQSGDGISEAGFAPPPGKTVAGGAKLDLHRRALAYAQKNQVEYITAVSILERGAMQ